MDRILIESVYDVFGPRYELLLSIVVFFPLICCLADYIRKNRGE